MEYDAMFRMMYLRREYTAFMDNLNEFQGLIFVPSVVTVAENDIWKGIVFIRSEKSPWHKGAFAFRVQFPPKYPFECPVARFESSLMGHPLLKNDADGTPKVVIPFNDDYVQSDPMRSSIMMRLLRYIRRLFIKDELMLKSQDDTYVPAIVDTRLSLQDVEQRSVSQEVVLSKPYVAYLTLEAKEWVLGNYASPMPIPRRACHRSGEHHGEDDNDDGVEVPASHRRDTAFSAWLTGTFLPETSYKQ